MKIKNIIFDWDGTIGMTLHLWLAGYRKSLRDQGHIFLDSVIAQDFFYEHDKGQAKYPDVDFEKLVDSTFQHVFDNLQSLQLYEGVSDVLEEISRSDVRLSLASSSSRKMLKKGLKKYDLEKYFESIFAGDDVTKHKPHPEVFKQTIKYLDIDPKETLIVGDSRADIIAGKAVNLSTCLFTPVENDLFYDFDELRLSKPDYCIVKQKELLSIL